jgi:hypothetical protein
MNEPKNPNLRFKDYLESLQPNALLSVGHWTLGFIWTLDIGH